jgi:hypothetical protein
MIRKKRKVDVSRWWFGRFDLAVLAPLLPGYIAGEQGNIIEQQVEVSWIEVSRHVSRRAGVKNDIVR